MAGRTIAIGDVHGCRLALEAVLNAIQPAPDDLIVALGDYIDRGLESRGVVDRLLRLRSECRLITLLGNHEVMFLEAVDSLPAFENWQRYGGRQMLQSYGGRMEDIPPEHWDFYRGLDLFFESEKHFFIHANYDADLPLNKQPEYLALWEHCDQNVPRPHCSGKTAIVGHTAQRSGEIFDRSHLVCIDTYCHGGGWLTALEVNTRECWQADRTGQLRGA
jgi:serine/threonine protein phosphatase 1